MSEPTGRTLKAGPASMIERLVANWREWLQQTPKCDEEFDNPLRHDKQYLVRELDDEFDHCSRYEKVRTAQELGMNGQNRKALAECDSAAADLHY